MVAKHYRHFVFCLWLYVVKGYETHEIVAYLRNCAHPDKDSISKENSHPGASTIDSWKQKYFEKDDRLKLAHQNVSARMTQLLREKYKSLDLETKRSIVCLEKMLTEFPSYSDSTADANLQRYFSGMYHISFLI